MARNGFDHYYLTQARGGGLPVFIGGPQRGHGIGGILSGLARMVVPILKKGGKSIMKETLRSGVDILGDVVSGSNFKTSAKRRLKQGGQRLVDKATRSLTAPQPHPPIRRNNVTIKARKRRGKTQSNPKSKRRKVVKTNHDIFS